MVYMYHFKSPIFKFCPKLTTRNTTWPSSQFLLFSITIIFMTMKLVMNMLQQRFAWGTVADIRLTGIRNLFRIIWLYFHYPCTYYDRRNFPNKNRNTRNLFAWNGTGSTFVAERYLYSVNGALIFFYFQWDFFFIRIGNKIF